MSIIKDWIPGDPLEPVMDVSDYFGEGALMISDGIPDFVLTPQEFDDLGIEGVHGCDRCDVVGVRRPPEGGWTACLKCGAGTNYARIWTVLHLGTSTEFQIGECYCGNANWACS